MGNQLGYIDSPSSYSDCNDGNASLYQNLTGYTDTDSDGYGTGTSQQVCSGASLPGGYVSNASDCNDGNGYVFQNVGSLAADSDNDRYYTGGTATRCVGGQSSYWYRGTGGGYTWLSSGSAYGSGDCNDSSASAWVNRYLDSDNDAYCASASTYCVGSEGGYRDSCTAYSDCSDANASAQVYKYADSDSDGYAPSASTYCVAAGSSPGYISSPSGFADCNDSNSYVYQLLSGIAGDYDQDGYTGTGPASACSGPSTSISGRTYYRDNAGGYSFLVDSQKLGSGDCSDSNASVYQTLSGYMDYDGDGYGAGSQQGICSGASLPSGYSASAGDCYDLNASAKPGQTSYFTSSRGDGSFDYNCDSGTETKQYTALGSCFQFDTGWTTENGGATSLPACGATQWWASCIGGICTDPCPGNQQTQACR